MPSVLVTTGSRLHFGLLRFGHPGERQFGGLGMMVDRPATKLRVSLTDRLRASGPDSERALSAARAWSRSGGTCREVGAQIDVIEAPPPHTGLGSGTQLALAVGLALDHLHGRSSPIESLAKRLGRTRRSSVGAFGFAHGGLIYEQGKLQGEDLGLLRKPIPLPEQWRIVLVRPKGMSGVSGEAELRAFRDLPPSDPAITERLIDLAERSILPAAESGDLDVFGERLTEYNRLAGSFYESIQGGPYLNREVEALVDRLIAAGAKGAGQSSWGPTVFAIAPGEPSAKQVLLTSGIAGDSRYEALIVPPRNGGAVAKIIP